MVSKGHSAFQVPGIERSLEWLGTANRERKLQEVRNGEEDKPQEAWGLSHSALASTWYTGDAPQIRGQNE